MVKVMVLRQFLQRGLSLLLAAVGFVVISSPQGIGGSAALAADAGKGASGWLQIPHPRKGKGAKCVADTDFMRRNHMKMLLHQRKQTVHNGIRTKRFSLKECISCHAYTEPGASRPVSIKSPKHFCRTCHDYAAVQIDCFQCHASRPEAAGGAKSGKPGKAAFLLHTGKAAARSLAQASQNRVAQNRDEQALANYVRSARR